MVFLHPRQSRVQRVVARHPPKSWAWTKPVFIRKIGVQFGKLPT